MKTSNTTLYAGAAVAVALAAVGGFGLARLTAPKAAEHAEAGEAHVEGALVLTPQALAASGVTLQTVAAGGLAAEIQSQGSVTASPSGEAVLTARAAGAISRIYKRLGDPVRAGETLAVVESREAAQIAADRSVAAARANLAGKVLAREKRLYEQRVSARQDYEQAEAEAAAAHAEARRAQAAAGAARISGDGRGVLVVSPISGRIMAAPAHLGAYVQPETELFRVADPSLIQVEAALSAAAAQRVVPGDRAIVETAEGRSIAATVRSITPGVSEETRAATAVLNLVGAQGIRPGQLVRVRILPAAGPTSAGIVVPEEAIQTVEGRDVVFVRTAKGFQATPVRLGQRSAGRAEVASGLKPGQVIAVGNAFLLKAELGKGEGEEH